MKLEKNMAIISLEDLQDLYKAREKGNAHGNTLFMICSIIRQHLDLGYENYWGSTFKGYPLKNTTDLIEEIMTVLMLWDPTFKTLLDLDIDKKEREMQAEAESHESDREAEEDRIQHELDEKG